MRQWRWLNRCYAFIGGYFWLPCPICGRYFGGHEWSESLYLGYGSGRGTCPWCVEETKRRNAEYWAGPAGHEERRVLSERYSRYSADAEPRG